MAPSDSEWVSVDAIVNGYETQLDSMVLIYRVDGPTQAHVKAAFGPDLLVVVSTAPLVEDTGWQKVTFDLSSLPCTPVTMTLVRLRLSAFGNSNPNGHMDIDAIRVYGHDCSLSTSIVAPTKDEANILQLQEGVQITTNEASEVFIHDLSGRMLFRKSNWNGTNFIPMNSGVYIIRAGNTVKKVVFP